MSDARTNILSAIAHNKRRMEGSADIPHTTVSCANLPQEQLVSLFEAGVLASSATIQFIEELKDLPQEVRNYILKRQLSSDETTFHLNSPLLKGLTWNPLTQLVSEASSSDCEIGITSAFCGVAETGSVALLSDSSRSTAAYFLPENLIIALATDDIVATQEFAWMRLKTEYPSMPRSVIFMTGPSRTGDIEQKIVIGAHGPRMVHLILYRRR